MMKTFALFGAALAVGLVATADEVWTTEIGDVVYERDIETGAAVFSWPLDSDGLRGEAFIDGLAGVFEGRFSYAGIWIEPQLNPGRTCAHAIAHPETGTPEYNWGQLEIIFVDSDFPSAWVMKRGFCFEDPSQFLVGKPIVANAKE